MLDYRQAARRVRRSVRTIKRWHKAGLKMSTAPDGRRLVEESRLLAWWRDRMTADPVHQLRLRRQDEAVAPQKEITDG
ncbi:hypothetical protein DC434_13865 [Microbacterium sp. TPD7012]|nr:hypothetical protein DC434_13865 [Microbacterium sp. TPD7012]